MSKEFEALDKQTDAVLNELEAIGRGGDKERKKQLATRVLDLLDAMLNEIGEDVTRLERGQRARP
jgi:hypothetical protein